MTKGLVLLATVLITACHKTTPPIDRRAALNQCMMGFYDEVPADNNPAGIE